MTKLYYNAKKDIVELDRISIIKDNETYVFGRMWYKYGSGIEMVEEDILILEYN